jgi:hypothetical protein
MSVRLPITLKHNKKDNTKGLLDHLRQSHRIIPENLQTELSPGYTAGPHSELLQQSTTAGRTTKRCHTNLGLVPLRPGR